jgi:hypothetical protein
VSVARQIGEHDLGAGERGLGIDEPVGLSERGEERGECFGYQIPLLIVMYNNRAYYNDWNHQIVMARTRGTDLSRGS